MKLFILLLFIWRSSADVFIQPGQKHVFSYAGSISGVSKIENSESPILFTLALDCKVEAETIIVERSRYRTKRLRVSLKDILVKDYSEIIGAYPPSRTWKPRQTTETVRVPDFSNTILESPFEVDIVNGEVHKVTFSSMETEETVNFKKVLLSALIIKLPGSGGHQNRIHRINMPDTWIVMEHGIDGMCENNYRISEIPKENLPESDAKLMHLDLCHGKKIFQVLRTRDVTKCEGRNLFMSERKYEECLNGECMGPHSQIVTRYLGCGYSKDTLDLHAIEDVGEHPEKEYKKTSIKVTVQVFSLDRVENIDDVLPFIQDPQSSENIVYTHAKTVSRMQRDASIIEIPLFKDSLCKCIKNIGGCYINPLYPSPQGKQCRCVEVGDGCTGYDVTCENGDVTCNGYETSLQACQEGSSHRPWWPPRAWFPANCGGYVENFDSAAWSQVSSHVGNSGVWMDYWAPATYNQNRDVEEQRLSGGISCTIDETGKATVVTPERFNPSLPLKGIIHGFTAQPILPFVPAWMRKYNNGVNVIMVDWYNLGYLLRQGETFDRNGYEQASRNSLIVGTYLGKCLAQLSLQTTLKSTDIHMVGHSIGGQMLGKLGRTYQKERGEKIGRLTGLDPVGMGFTKWRINKQDQLGDTILEGEVLSNDAAQFVDVIHTNSELVPVVREERDSLGMAAPMGHMDFYPDGGKLQETCQSMPQNEPLDICNHNLAVEYYIRSLETRCPYPSQKCSSLEECQEGHGFGPKMFCMGESSQDQWVDGEQPFLLYTEATRQLNSFLGHNFVERHEEKRQDLNEHQVHVLLENFKQYLLRHKTTSLRPVVEDFFSKLELADQRFKESVAFLVKEVRERRSCNNTAEWEFKQQFGLGLACGLPNLDEQLDPEYLLSLVIQQLSADTYKEILCDNIDYTVSRVAHCDKYQFGQRQILPDTMDISRHIIHSPHVADWRTDAAFINNFLNGVNPMMIKKVNAMGELHNDLRALTVRIGDRDETMASLVQQKKLLMVDYSILDVVPIHDNKPLYAPQVLMYLHSQQLKMVAILLVSKTPSVRTQLLTPSSVSPRRWLFAKMHVALADGQAHEFLHHLPLHFMMETVAVANNNWLKNHAVGKLLNPHFKGTVMINFIARNSLLSPHGDSTVEKLFAVGQEGALRLTGVSFNFSKLEFPNQMINRGFDEGINELPGFHYKNDGWRIWNILKRFVYSTVNHLYQSDSILSKDKELQSWAATIASNQNGNIPDFPERIPTKHDLVNILTTLIFSASAQHQALNAPQYMYSYVPHRPLTLNNWMPEESDSITERFLVESLPSQEQARHIFKTSNLISKQSLCTLDKGTGAELEAFIGENNREYKNIRNRMIMEMEDLSQDIQARGWSPHSYTFLDPRKIACSIDI